MVTTAPSPQRRIRRRTVLAQIKNERREQDKRFGGARWDDKVSRTEWMEKIRDHVGRGIRAVKSVDDAEFRKQLIEIAALAVAAIESHDRRVRAGRKPL